MLPGVAAFRRGTLSPYHGVSRTLAQRVTPWPTGKWLLLVKIGTVDVFDRAEDQILFVPVDGPSVSVHYHMRSGEVAAHDIQPLVYDLCPTGRVMALSNWNQDLVAIQVGPFAERIPNAVLMEQVAEAIP